MTPSRPYLVRALNEWILDNQCTPYVLVDASLAGVQVPQDYVNKGQIVLNISMTAVQNLLIDDQGLSFNARFGGVPMSVYVPTVAILAIYAKENGQGMVFGSEAGAPDPNTPPEPPKPKQVEPEKKAGAGRPSLKVVK
ncbi:MULTISPECIES: ClpXP protease specificity-enhancing factor [unclassified Oceanobacter]|uniref:ClpXP protease specificity-enhancing factor n=1 Tax=unclassified Oceanobacter TaxID=2620260 RepID=UPI002736A637|nr:MULTISPECIES: ClpXP protease specificity-enhancing factor [unclassified Oceanobacter]MDP2610105.1 ClpXP protease specificity-enhancing factor [Oceanobacter sp. 1_MG-2023]MDP2612320.1 ClpXP protease specificity-enhancing factor [Oceanobacter sp. 2_MG-2023]